MLMASGGARADSRDGRLLDEIKHILETYFSDDEYSFLADFTVANRHNLVRIETLSQIPGQLLV